MHDYHDVLQGFSPNQVLHDGCGECEERARSIDHGIAHLDRQNFARAWDRAAQWNRSGLPDIARAEIPMFNVLWSVQLKLAQYGCEIGRVPHE